MGVRSLYLIIMGKWSEDMSVVVAHSHRDAMSNVARDTSGDVAEISKLYGVRVGVSRLLLLCPGCLCFV